MQTFITKAIEATKTNYFSDELTVEDVIYSLDWMDKFYFKPNSRKVRKNAQMDDIPKCDDLVSLISKMSILEVDEMAAYFKSIENNKITLVELFNKL